MNVEDVALADIIIDPANVRKHDARNIETIKGSLARWGQQKPIVVDKRNVIVAGNGTVEAARLLGWTSIRVVRSELIGAERTAYAIADNRSAELAAWDDGLAEALAALQKDELVDVNLTGFTADEIEQLINEALDPTQDTTSQLGGLEYRVVVDCMSEAHQAELLDRFEREGLTCRALMS